MTDEPTNQVADEKVTAPEPQETKPDENSAESSSTLETPVDPEPEVIPESEKEAEEPVKTEETTPKVDDNVQSDQKTTDNGDHSEKEKPADSPKVNIEEEVNKKLNEKVTGLLQKANQERKDRRQSNLEEIIKLANQKEINNQDVRDLLHVATSTATEYLKNLVNSGKLKSAGKGKSRIYKVN